MVQAIEEKLYCFGTFIKRDIQCALNWKVQKTCHDVKRSTQDTEEAENQDGHPEVTGHTMKPSQPNTTIVETTAN